MQFLILKGQWRTLQGDGDVPVFELQEILTNSWQSEPVVTPVHKSIAACLRFHKADLMVSHRSALFCMYWFSLCGTWGMQQCSWIPGHPIAFVTAAVGMQFVKSARTVHHLIRFSTVLSVAKTTSPLPVLGPPVSDAIRSVCWAPTKIHVQLLLCNMFLIFSSCGHRLKATYPG